MSAAPNPSKLLLWGAVGIGAYFIFTRMNVGQAVAAQQSQVDASKNYRDAAYAQAIGGLVGQVGDLFTGRGASAGWGTGGGQWNNPSAYTAPLYPDYGAPSGATGAWV